MATVHRRPDVAFCAAARAGTFASVHYDARTDDLVAAMIYQGTNPNHSFTLKWAGFKHIGLITSEGASVLLYEPLPVGLALSIYSSP